MASPLLDSNLIFIAGAKDYLGILVWDESNPNTDLSTATATVAVYDKNGGVTWAAGAATVSGTSLISVTRLWDTTGVAAGEYRVVVIVTFGSLVKPFQFGVRVDPLPAPQ